jgi:hypothetical protein
VRLPDAGEQAAQQLVRPFDLDGVAVLDQQDDFIPGDPHRHAGARSVGVPGEVRQRLADHSQQFRDDVVRDGRVDRAGGVERGPEAQRFGRGVDRVA